jgi:hypothetical protein
MSFASRLVLRVKFLEMIAEDAKQLGNRLRMTGLFRVTRPNVSLTRHRRVPRADDGYHTVSG